MKATLSFLFILATIVPAIGQGPIYIRGLRYENMSRGTSISPRTVAPGGTFAINLPRSFGRVLRTSVTLEDARRPSYGGGVTNFALRQLRLSGNRIVCRAPAHASFLNRTFNVAAFVFVNGVTRYYANAGSIRIARATPGGGGGTTPVSTGSSTLGYRPIYIRGLRYGDMSRGTRLHQRRVAPGGTITVTLPRSFGRVIRSLVVLEDVNRRRDVGGVTHFSLRTQLSGNRITARVPNNAVLRNRTFNVAVFVFVNGSTRLYGSAGTLQVVQYTQPLRYNYPTNGGNRIPNLRTPRGPVRYTRR